MRLEFCNLMLRRKLWRKWEKLRRKTFTPKIAKTKKQSSNHDRVKERIKL